MINKKLIYSKRVRFALSLLVITGFTLTAWVLGISSTRTNTFKEVKIGQQVWMAENLHVFNFRNGDPIPIAKTDDEWKKAIENEQPACCYYENDGQNGQKYGLLYNWYVVNDSRGLAPKGWKVPSDDDWTILTDYLGDLAGTKMKSTNGWKEYDGQIECNNCKSWPSNRLAGETCNVCKDTRKINSLLSGNGTNESGFSGLPGGYRLSYGTFTHLGIYAYWWSSTEYSSTGAWYRSLDYGYSNVDRGNGGRTYGRSVRCVRDL